MVHGAVVVCMLAMYFVHPASVLGPKGALMLGIALLGLGNVFFEFASVNYNAMLNHLGEKEDRGKISGFGWASGYIGGIVLLLILYVGLIGTNLLGVPTDEYLPIRISMVIAALWLGGFAIPVILHPPLPKKVHTGGDHESHHRLLRPAVAHRSHPELRGPAHPLLPHRLRRLP